MSILGLYLDITTAAARASEVNTRISNIELAAVAQARLRAMGKGAPTGAAAPLAACGAVIVAKKQLQARSNRLRDLEQDLDEAKERIPSCFVDKDDSWFAFSDSTGSVFLETNQEIR